MFPPSLFSRGDSLPHELDASLRRLGRASAALDQHHFPSPRTPIATAVELMADAVEAGKVRAGGVSSAAAAQLREAHAALARRGIPLASNQVQCSLLHRQPETGGVLDACREQGVTLIAYPEVAALGKATTAWRA